MVIIIPDIHGRQFWKDAVKDRENEDIIFLGDYMDSYKAEEIDYNKALRNFKEIIAFANEHKNVTLLLGNHDIHYLFDDRDLRSSRYDYLNAATIKKTFETFNRQFQLAAERVINGKRYIFSHAGICRDWLASHELSIQGWTDENIVDYVNNAFEVKNASFICVLGDISFRRGGWKDTGSMIWADVFDFIADSKHNEIIGDYQIFGHTQLNEFPIISDKYADLDIRRGFLLNSDGVITELDGTPAIKIDELQKNKYEHISNRC